MRFPNLRYGNPNELRHYAQFIPLTDLAKRLRRDERTVRDWMAGKTKVPWWVPEILRLQNMEHAERMRQMGFEPVRKQLGLVTGDVITFTAREPRTEKKSAPSRDTDLFQLRKTG